MAKVTIGEFEGYWQDFDNWVTGNATSVPKVLVPGNSAISMGVINATAATTAQQLTSVSCNEVTVIAKKGNTDKIFIGDSSVSATNYGIELAAGEDFTFKIKNLNMLYMFANVSSEGVSYIAY